MFRTNFEKVFEKKGKKNHLVSRLFDYGFFIEIWRAKIWPQKRISADMTPQKPQKPPQKPQKPPQKPIAETKTEPNFDIKNSNFNLSACLRKEPQTLMNQVIYLHMNFFSDRFQINFGLFLNRS